MAALLQVCIEQLAQPSHVVDLAMIEITAAFPSIPEGPTERIARALGR